MLFLTDVKALATALPLLSTVDAVGSIIAGAEGFMDSLNLGLGDAQHDQQYYAQEK